MTDNDDPLAGVPASMEAESLENFTTYIDDHAQQLDAFRQRAIDLRNELSKANQARLEIEAQAAAMREQIERTLAINWRAVEMLVCDHDWESFPAEATFPLQAALDSDAGRDLLERLHAAGARVRRLRAVARRADIARAYNDIGRDVPRDAWSEMGDSLEALKPGDLGDES